MNLKIDPKGLPPEGLHLEGSAPASIFDLAEDDPAKACGPLTWQLDILRDGDDLIVTGAIAALFELQCVRCTEKFQHQISLGDYQQVIPLENEMPVDLTTWLREDILLALPIHPHCDTGNVTPRECPAEGRFDPVTDHTRGQPEQADNRDLWKALDQLPNLNRK